MCVAPTMLSGHVTDVAAAIVAVISHGGYPGLALLMALESACIPLPSEIILPFAGYLASTGRFSLYWVATAGALGCSVGSGVAYAISVRFGRSFVERWGGRLLIGRRELGLADSFFERFGSAAVFVGRFLPIVRTFIAVPAGLARMNWLKFQVYTFIGSWLWCFGLAWLGARLGAAWDSDPGLRTAFARSEVAIVAALGFGALYLFWRRRRPDG